MIQLTKEEKPAVLESKKEITKKDKFAQVSMLHKVVSEMEEMKEKLEKKELLPHKHIFIEITSHNTAIELLDSVLVMGMMSFNSIR